MMRANGFVEDNESRVPLVDPNADEYLAIEISGDDIESEDGQLEHDDMESLQRDLGNPSNNV